MRIIESYKELKRNIPLLIEASGYKDNYIARKIGMPIPNFSAKKRRSNWDEEDIERIIKVISSPNEEVEDILDAIEAKLAMQSEDVSYEEYKLEIAKWK
ncbi:MAG TPA: hypothetical protein DCL77_10745 [Prolixibacteraceae bacterium]|jgi:hypothetical protein|nr:hypothetical protein [Prolixibacteraceae bacterium]